MHRLYSVVNKRSIVPEIIDPPVMVVQTAQPMIIIILAVTLCTMFLLGICIMMNVFRRLKRYVLQNPDIDNYNWVVLSPRVSFWLQFNVFYVTLLQSYFKFFIRYALWRYCWRLFWNLQYIRVLSSLKRALSSNALDFRVQNGWCKKPFSVKKCNLLNYLDQSN